MERMRTLERVVDARIDLLEFERADAAKEDCPFCRSLDCDIIFALLFTLVIACLLVLIMVFWLKGVLQYEELECDHMFTDERGGEFSFPILPRPPTNQHDAALLPPPPPHQHEHRKTRNLQCIYTFIAGQGQRVKIDFDEFHLAGTADNCELEYVDIYSELESEEDDLLSASLGGRYCGTVSPNVRISLHRVLVLVFHSRMGHVRDGEPLRFRGRYSLISEQVYIPGSSLGRPGQRCGFRVRPSKRKRPIFSPTYPGTYPKNFHCTYLLEGEPNQRIKLTFKDFDIYFGGEHCPYDFVTVYDGPNNTSPIIKKICGLQQRVEIYSVGPNLFIEFNTSAPAKADPRGFVIEYEFSSRFVDVMKLLDGQPGVTHMRGSECDVRVASIRETTHYIQSPGYPLMYPENTTCVYVLDGLQGEQNLEKVQLTFEHFAVISDTSDNPDTVKSLRESNVDDLTCAYAYVGIVTTEANTKSAMNPSEDVSYDATLCERLAPGSPQLETYVSEGPRMVVVFGTTDKIPTDGGAPLGFRAKIEFKTDFGIPGEPVGGSNECNFRFKSKRGYFNSPRYPANYPLDTNCTYEIKANPGEQILIHFEQFALHSESKDDICKDWLEIYDVFYEKGNHNKTRYLQARYCSDTFPGPRVSTFGSHEMEVVFSSDTHGTGNGFKALYEIRRAPKEDIPSKAGESMPTGYVVSPGYPVKYKEDQLCDWEIIARPGRQILLNLVKMEVEGSVDDKAASCQKAVIRITNASIPEICGTDPLIFKPMLTPNNSVRISFFTAPDKVNGLKGFNLTWTEVRSVQEISECSRENEYMCSYSKLCIDASLRCNGDENCGEHDDTDETHCVVDDSPKGVVDILRHLLSDSPAVSSAATVSRPSTATRGSYSSRNPTVALELLLFVLMLLLLSRH